MAKRAINGRETTGGPERNDELRPLRQQPLDRYRVRRTCFDGGSVSLAGGLWMLEKVFGRGYDFRFDCVAKNKTP